MQNVLIAMTSSSQQGSGQVVLLWGCSENEGNAAKVPLLSRPLTSLHMYVL